MRKCFICGSADGCRHRERTLREHFERIDKISTVLRRNSTALFGTEKQRQLLHRIAKSSLDSALTYGLLVRPKCCDACEIPGPLIAHHRDLERPLDVAWLCAGCSAAAEPLWKTATLQPVDVGGNLQAGPVLHKLPQAKAKEIHRERVAKVDDKQCG